MEEKSKSVYKLTEAEALKLCEGSILCTSNPNSKWHVAGHPEIVQKKVRKIVIPVHEGGQPVNLLFNPLTRIFKRSSGKVVGELSHNLLGVTRAGS